MFGSRFQPYPSMQEMNLDWILTKVKNILRFIPDGGYVGQILRRTPTGAEWSNETAGGAVDSVNGQTGTVVLTASDVGALPDSYTAPVDSVNGQTGTVVLGKSDVGLGNVENERQYSAQNPPPYPVTSVNGQTGAVVVSGGAVDSVNGQTGTVVLGKSDIGLENVDNVQQYSATNPPPYPVTSVNGQTGAVVVSGGAVDSVNGQTGTVVLGKSDIGLGNVDNVQQYSATNPPPYPVTSVNGQTGAVDTAIAFTITLTAAGWSSNQQTVNNAYFLANGYAYIIAPNSNSFEDYAGAMIYADNVNTDGVLRFYCVTAPSNNLTVNVIRMVV